MKNIIFFCCQLTNLGVIVTALPCRLQNDSPPNSIEQPHLNKENDSPTKTSNILTDSPQRIGENNNSIKTPKMPLDLENAIDESNYVNLNDLTAKCKAMSNDLSIRNSQKVTDVIVNGVDKSNQYHLNANIENKNSKLNNFYLQINPTLPITNGHNVQATKPIMSIVNQKNLNNLNSSNNNNNNIAKSNLTNVSNGNSNGLINSCVTNANHLNSNNSNSNSNNNNSNATNGSCNGQIDTSIDTKLMKTITTNGNDYNKNGLPAVSTTHMQNDVVNGHQTQCTNKNGNANNVAPQSYVIHNGNGLMTNGNNGIKELPRSDCNKGMSLRLCLSFFILLLFSAFFECN